MWLPFTNVSLQGGMFEECNFSTGTTSLSGFLSVCPDRLSCCNLVL